MSARRQRQKGEQNITREVIHSYKSTSRRPNADEDADAEDGDSEDVDVVSVSPAEGSQQRQPQAEANGKRKRAPARSRSRSHDEEHLRAGLPLLVLQCACLMNRYGLSPGAQDIQSPS